jgi:transposase
MMTPQLGIDIAQDTFDTILKQESHKPVPGHFDNKRSGFNQLHRFLKKRKIQDLHICMEATGVYYEALATFLHQKGYRVSVVNPARIKGYAQSQMRRNKTDKMDAAVIADFCRAQNPPLWHPPDPSWHELRSLVRHLEDLESDRQRQRNRHNAIQHSAQPTQTVLDNLQDHIDFLTQQIDAVKKQMQDHIDQHPELKQQRDLLDSIESIGPLTAAKMMAEYGDMRQFDNVRQVVAFAGLNPKHRQSGTSIRGQTKISKMGRSSIRAALYMPAINAKRFNTLLRPFVQRLEEKGLSGMQIIVAVMRKLLHLAFGVLKSGQPFDPNFLKKEAAIA